MLRNFLNSLFGPFTDSKTPVGDFVKLLQETYIYLRQHRFCVISTKLPDEMLERWLLPMPGDAKADEYLRNFVGKKDTLSASQLPMFVFEYVLRKRFRRDLKKFDQTEMEAAAVDLRNYIRLLNYISRMRESEQTPIEFDIFDVENYPAILEQIETQVPDPNPPATQARLSEEEVNARRNEIFRELIDGYIDEVIRVLKEYMSIDLRRCENEIVCVVFRDVAHFDINPRLSMRENSCDMFVDKVVYEDNESFSLYLTEANIHLDDLASCRFPWRKIKRTDKQHHIVLRRGESMSAPCILPSSFALLKNIVRRYDECERGLRKKVEANKHEMQEEVNGFFEDIKQAADRHGIDFMQMINRL